jgi:RecB family endonuclease NucS
VRQHAEPAIVNGVNLLQPTRIHFTDSDMVESWLQELLYSHPSLLPVEEIEPAFGPLIPLCRELSTEAGPADLICCSPYGLITIVETKLWRNPQARRE